MMKEVAVITFVVVLASVEARGHHHHRHHHGDSPIEKAKKPVKKDVAFENEANSLRAMMEGVKTTTDKAAGLATVAPRAASKVEESVEGLTSKMQDDHAVDEDILGKAKEMQAMMFKHDSLAPKKKAKKSLVKVTAKQEDSQEARAARYFATHGMEKMGKMLGETMDKGAAAKAAAMMKSALKMDKEEQLDSAAGSLDMDDDDEDASQKARWAKVDELRRKAALRGHA